MLLLEIWSIGLSTSTMNHEMAFSGWVIDFDRIVTKKNNKINLGQGAFYMNIDRKL